MTNLIFGDCLPYLKTRPAENWHLIIQDPPYGLEFMGKKWDAGLPDPAIWAECLRGLKPGGFMVCFSSTRTYHRLAAAIEDAGFVVHPMIGYCFGSGFPKAQDVGKGIDKKAGSEREIIGHSGDRPIQTGGRINAEASANGKFKREKNYITAPCTPAAKQWNGYKYGLQALKPAFEPIGVFQKPWTGSQIENITREGCGAYNVDAGRVASEKKTGWAGSAGTGYHAWRPENYGDTPGERARPTDGRYPANLILDTEAAAAMDRQSGELKSGFMRHDQKRNTDGGFNGGFPQDRTGERDTPGDIGGASRFFQKCDFWAGDFESFYYTAKADNQEREAGTGSAPAVEYKAKGGARTYNDRCGNCGKKFIGPPDKICSCEKPVTDSSRFKQVNNHPTLKPLSIMIYLLKLFVCPVKPFRVLDCFMGSGTVGMAAQLFDGVEYTGVEMDPHYYGLAQSRIKWAEDNRDEMKRNSDRRNQIDLKEVQRNAGQISMI